MVKYIRGYKIVALIQIFMCVCFFINPGTDAYGAWFGILNFAGAGVLFFGSILAYFDPKQWTLWLLAITMLVLIFLNVAWFTWNNVFITTGFPLIAYDCLFVVVNMHFLGRGLA